MMSKLLAIWNFIYARIQEPSTHASISALLGIAGLQLDTGVIHDGMVALSLIFGAIGIVIKEYKPDPTV